MTAVQTLNHWEAHVHTVDRQRRLAAWIAKVRGDQGGGEPLLVVGDDRSNDETGPSSRRRFTWVCPCDATCITKINVPPAGGCPVCDRCEWGSTMNTCRQCGTEDRWDVLYRPHLTAVVEDGAVVRVYVYDSVGEPVGISCSACGWDAPAEEVASHPAYAAAESDDAPWPSFD